MRDWNHEPAALPHACWMKLDSVTMDSVTNASAPFSWPESTLVHCSGSKLSNVRETLKQHNLFLPVLLLKGINGLAGKPAASVVIADRLTLQCLLLYVMRYMIQNWSLLPLQWNGSPL